MGDKRELLDACFGQLLAARAPVKVEAAPSLFAALVGRDNGRVKQLLQCKAEVGETVDEKGYPLVACAVDKGMQSATAELLAAQASPLLAAHYTRETALHIAARKGDLICLAPLLRDKRVSMAGQRDDVDQALWPVNALDIDGNSPADRAWQTGGEEGKEAVVMLLEAGGRLYRARTALAEAPTRSVHTPPFAVTEEFGGLLVKAQADLEAQIDGRTGVIIAAALGDYVQMKALLRLKADARATTSDGETAMHVGEAGNPDKELMLQLLVQMNADPAAMDRHHAQPLHAAARKGDLDAVKTLLQFPGLHYQPRNSDGDRPVDVARAMGFTDIVRVLERGKDK